jgi:hypothetical protein
MALGDAEARACARKFKGCLQRTLKLSNSKLGMFAAGKAPKWATLGPFGVAVRLYSRVCYRGPEKFLHLEKSGR